MYAAIQNIIDLIYELAPPYMALEGDRIGLQIGDPERKIKNALVALDFNREVLREAIQNEAGLIITHHPLFYRPIYSLDLRRNHDRLIADLIKEDIAIFSAHTNLDAAPQGVNFVLAESFNLKDIEIIQVQGFLPVEKLVTFVPEDYIDQVRDALTEAGAGWIGKYSHCTFQVQGTGTFKPLPGADPFIGKKGHLERVYEYRLETILLQKSRKKVLKSLFAAHPYEEVAYDIYPLDNEHIPYGFGCLGTPEWEMTLKELALLSQGILKTDFIKLIGDPEMKIRRIAVCGGSGAALIRDAALKGADVLITGDIKYHDAQEADNLGIAILDAGHDITERPVISYLATWLQNRLSNKGYSNKIISSEINTLPWQIIGKDRG